MKKRLLLLSLIFSAFAFNLLFAFPFPENMGGLTKGIYQLYSELESEDTLPLWIFFRDRGISETEIQDNLIDLKTKLSERTLKRRAKGGNPELDLKDLPVNLDYVTEIEITGAIHRTTTRYLNGISVDATLTQAQVIASLPFVKSIVPVARMHRTEPDKTNIKNENPVIDQPTDLNYGPSYIQLAQINVPALHERGITGAGVLVCLLDTGCNTDHFAFYYMDIQATWDFINDDPIIYNEPGDPFGQHNHGTYTLSTCGGEVDNELYGPAFESSYIVGKTEMTDQEIPIEEDYYVEGVEWADSIGAEVISTSLGYLDWYTFEDLDGNTCVTTIAVDIAVANGIVFCTAAGNERNSSWGHIIAPADADSVIAVGAVNDQGELASFSSPGPTYDGRIKPEVCAMGVDVHCASPNNIYGFTEVNGTSLSTPLLGGVSALVIQAHPNWSPMKVRESLMETADNSLAPNNDFGWGIVNALAAVANSDPPVIQNKTPEEDLVTTQINVPLNFGVTASDLDEDPLTYSFYVDDSLISESESDNFEYTFENPGNYDVKIVVRDVILFADSASWTVEAEASGVGWNDTDFIPNKLSLSAYPNPFNPETMIAISLPEEGNAVLSIFDIQGREIARLMDGYHSAGIFNIRFNPENIATGIYLAKLSCETGVFTQKLLYIK